MNNNNSTYKRLGDYIREVDVRNTDLQCSNLLGLSNAKVFIPSIANTIGTDLRSYKIVKHFQFAYVPVTSRNGDKITIALYTGDEPAIISQAYVVFEIVGACGTVETRRATSLQQLLPEYLMMWFRRSEFDRYARFHSNGSAREVFDWEEMCNVMLPVPPIEEQQRIVNRYQAIENRIANNKQTIAKLEEAAQALYRKMFVDGIDVENLPEGWRMGKLGDVCEITDGTHDSPKPTKEGYPLITSVHLEQWSINKENAYLISKQDYTKINERSIVEIGDILYSMIGTIGNISLVSEKVDFAVKNMAIIKSSKNKEFIEYIFIFFKSKEMKDIISSNLCGSTQNYITLSILRDIRIKIPTQEMIRNFHKKAYKIIKLIILYNNEIKKLTEFQSLLLAKMGR